MWGSFTWFFTHKFQSARHNGRFLLLTFSLCVIITYWWLRDRIVLSESKIMAYKKQQEVDQSNYSRQRHLYTVIADKYEWVNHALCVSFSQRHLRFVFCLPKGKNVKYEISLLLNLLWNSWPLTAKQNDYLDIDILTMISKFTHRVQSPFASTNTKSHWSCLLEDQQLRCQFWGKI